MLAKKCTDGLGIKLAPSVVVLKRDRKREKLETTVMAHQKGFELQIADLAAALKAQAEQIQG